MKNKTKSSLSGGDRVQSDPAAVGISKCSRIAAADECERHLWRLVTSAAGTTATAAASVGKANQLSQLSDHGTSFIRISEMMRDILESPTFQSPPDEDPWTSNWTITFPSDPAWQDVIYKKMLERQRVRKLKFLEEMELLENCDSPQEKMHSLMLERRGTGTSGGGVIHDWNIVPTKPKKAPFHAPAAARLSNIRGVGHNPITWTVEDIALAGRLLHVPPMPVEFADEQEMRRVYTLIYDVFRYKNIFSQSLDDVQFFKDHPEMEPMTTRVWLLVFDLYHRSFKKRSTVKATKAAQLFPDAGLQLVETTLWQERVKLAAAIARIRIKRQALRLSELLPFHLRDGRSSRRKTGASITAWVNTKKVKSPEEIKQSLTKLLNLNFVEERTPLGEDTFKWDPHCPQFFVFHPSVRNRLSQSSLVKKHKMVLQDKSFCVGPATFVKIVSDLQLTGSVIQSHVNSPRTTAYLASILSQNDNIKKLLAFSAGNRKTEYENYFNDLGIKNILLFSEKMYDLPADSNNLEEVVAVFATPPNSYSAVADPIDFVCSRGGDLAMLEVLTETEDTDEGRKRVASILDEQQRTLKYAMSRPQIQFVLYETHSEISAENTQMIEKTVKEINKHAHIHHAVAQGKLKGLQAQKEMTDDNDDSSIASQAFLDDKRKRALKDVVVPESDLFDQSALPDLCQGEDDCLKLKDEGCYLALVQRKQVSRMDNKYMIQMAENRGVFGADPNSPKKKVAYRKRVEDTSALSPTNKAKRRFKDIEVERLQNPTKASMAHAKNAQPEECLRESSNTSKVSQSRRWWAETTRHIHSLRLSVSKHKLQPQSVKGDAGDKNKSTITTTTTTNNNNNNDNNRNVITSEPTVSVNVPRQYTGAQSEDNVKRFVSTLWLKSGKVDEVAARSRRTPHAIPIHPKLRLTRFSDKLDNKVSLPVAVTTVTFPPKSLMRYSSVRNYSFLRTLPKKQAAVTIKSYSSEKKGDTGGNGKSEWRGIVTRFLPIGLCLVAVMQWRAYRKYSGERIASQLEVDCYTTLPLKAISRCWGVLADLNQPTFLRPYIYGTYANLFGVNIAEAANEDLKSYHSLSEFFIRTLKDDVRPIDPQSELVSPCDGRVLHITAVSSGKVEQVKGITYTIESFLGENMWNRPSTPQNDQPGEYEKSLLVNKDNCLYQCVIYLAPGDYHRFHSPAEWKPFYRRHFPGQLLSVNPSVARWIPGLFCINERAVYVGEWKHGFFSYTPVGATNVGSMHVYFDRALTTNNKKVKEVNQKFLGDQVHIHKGDMIGEFRMGSTIVLLFEAPKTFRFTISPGQRVRVGQAIGSFKEHEAAQTTHSSHKVLSDS